MKNFSQIKALDQIASNIYRIYKNGSKKKKRNTFQFIVKPVLLQYQNQTKLSQDEKTKDQYLTNRCKNLNKILANLTENIKKQII